MPGTSLAVGCGVLLAALFLAVVDVAADFVVAGVSLDVAILQGCLCRAHG